jgi:hypothetical protein
MLIRRHDMCAGKREKKDHMIYRLSRKNWSGYAAQMEIHEVVDIQNYIFKT